MSLNSTRVAPLSPEPKMLMTLPGWPKEGEKMVMDDAHAGRIPAAPQHVEHLRLHRNIKCGGHFVGDQQPRLTGECHRKH